MDSVNKCSLLDGPLSCAWEKREAAAYPEFSVLAPHPTLSPPAGRRCPEGAHEGQWRLTRRHLLAGLCLDPRVKPENDGVRGGTLYPPQTSQHAGAREENTNASPQSSSSGLTRGSRHKRSGTTVKGQTSDLAVRGSVRLVPTEPCPSPGKLEVQAACAVLKPSIFRPLSHGGGRTASIPFPQSARQKASTPWPSSI